MKPSEILLLGMKKRVAAMQRSTGEIIWETKLKGGQGDFVTLLCDGPRIFAAAGGHLHCLDFKTGEILWSNNLPGYGYDLATLCLPDGASAPDSAALPRPFPDAGRPTMPPPRACRPHRVLRPHFRGKDTAPHW